MSDQAQAVAPEEAMLDLLGANEEQPEEEHDEEQADEAPEGDEEAEEVAQAEPEPELIELTYNGEKVKKTKDEVTALAQQGFDYTQKTQQLAEERRFLQAQAKAAQEQAQLQHAVIDQLTEAKSIQAQLAQYENVDWNALIASDPVQAMQLDRQYRELQGYYGTKVNEINQLSQQAKVHSEAIRTETLNKERQALLKAVPEWTDGEKAQAESVDVQNFLATAGFTDDEIKGVYDHRHLVVARKAMLYDKLMASKPEITKKVASAPKPVKPGTAQQRNPKGEAYGKHKDALKKTGRSDAAEAALLALL